MSVETHKTHCCGKHGCKYGKEACPVKLGEVEQTYPCEQCRPVSALESEIEALKEEIEWSAKLEFRGMHITDNW